MNSSKPILFVCASDTLVRLLAPIAEAMASRNVAYRMAKLRFTDETAEFELGQTVPRALYAGTVKHQAGWIRQFRGIVLGNDWGREARALILLARHQGVPTICVQESVINFTDAMRRMRFADHALVQGEVSRQHLCDRQNVHIAGNPRYEQLVLTPRDPDAPVLLNCNFTYGVEEHHRDEWLKAAIASCRVLGKSALILQHPRDVADLTPYGVPSVRTSSSTIHDRLRAGSAVITRFSSVIHEAVALGRPAVYFNPHQEAVGYDFGDECAVLRHARDADALTRALRSVDERPPAVDDYERYLQAHIRPLATRPSQACADLIAQIVATPVPSSAGGGVQRLGLLAYCIAEQGYLLARGRL